MQNNTTQKYYDITNRFMFGRVFSNPNNVRPLLEAVLGVPIGQILYVDEEHDIEPSLRGKGVRMDVFVDDGSGTVYDVEMQNQVERDLPLRSRYLLSSFDRDRINRGDSYHKLGQSVVIFVCTQDPIGYGDRVYVVRPMLESRGIPYNDGTLRVFLNAFGASEDDAQADDSGASQPLNKKLSAFLRYVDGGGTMGDEWVASLDDEVQRLNDDQGWRDTVISFEMLLEDEKYRSREQGLEEGREEGRKQGLEEGREEGRKQGLEEGREEGRAEGREEGREQGIELVGSLYQCLQGQGRLDEFAAALHDEVVMQRLLKEFSLLDDADNEAARE